MVANQLVTYVKDIIKSNFFSNEIKANKSSTELEIVELIKKDYNYLITDLKENEYTYKHIEINGRCMFESELLIIAKIVYSVYYTGDIKSYLLDL